MSKFDLNKFQFNMLPNIFNFFQQKSPTSFGGEMHATLSYFSNTRKRSRIWNEHFV